MNERITKQIEEMKKQTIGVEVEMNNIRRDKAAELAAAFFGTGRFENTVYPLPSFFTVFISDFSPRKPESRAL